MYKTMKDQALDCEWCPWGRQPCSALAMWHTCCLAQHQAFGHMVLWQQHTHVQP